MMSARTVLLLMALCVLLLPLAAQERTRRFFAPGSEPGMFRLLEPPISKPVYELPEPGFDNACDEGSIRSMQVSPDGRYVVGEVVARETISLCLYDLSQMKDTPSAGMYVRVARISASGLVETKSPSRSRTGSSRSAEGQASWALQPNSRFPLVFVRDDERRPPRLVGLTDVRQGEPSDAVSLELEPRAAYGLSMPSWGPGGLASGHESSLAVVSERGLRCGRSAIQRLSWRKEGLGLEALSDPCQGRSEEERGRDPNVADRYPAWSPQGGLGKLAFIRVLPDRTSRLCVLSSVSMVPSTYCYEPTEQRTRQKSRLFPSWDATGRFLAVYAGEPAGSDGGLLRMQVELYDQDNPSGNPAQVVEDVRALEHQGPTFMTVGDKTWLYVVKEGGQEAAKGNLRRQLLPTGGVQESVDTGLTLLRGVVVLWRGETPWLVLLARGHRDVPGVSLRRDRLFLMRLPSVQLGLKGG